MMMKRIFLLVFLCFFSYASQAQTLRRSYSIDAHKPVDARTLLWYNYIESGQGHKPLNPTEQSSDKTSSLSSTPLGKASNPYTIISNSVNQLIAVDNADDNKDMVAWIHRQDIDSWGGSPTTTANGVHRIDFIAPENSGYCRQGQWNIDVGPFNPLPYPNSCRPRYPQAILYTPENSSGFNDNRVVWISPCTDGSSWGNYNWGLAWNLCNFGKGRNGQNETNASMGDLPAWQGFLSNQQDNMVFIPSGLCQGRKGEFWFVDNAYKPSGTGGNFQDSIFLYKGTIANNQVNWKRQHTLRLGRDKQFYNPKNNGNPVIGEATMEFSPDGKWGWVVTSAIILDNPNDATKQKEFESKPVFFWSDNYGDTWNGPIVVRLRDYAQVKDSIQTRFLGEAKPNGTRDTLTSSGVPALLGAPELTVDKNGNPHVLWNMGNTADVVEKGILDSLGYFQAFMSMYDITTDDQGKTWCPKFIHRTIKYQGTVEGTNLGFNNYTQIARDPEGERIFYSWIDDTTTATRTNAMLPNLHQRALRISDGAMTDLEIITLGQQGFENRMFFPTVSPTVLKKANGTYVIPTVYASAIQNENDQTGFAYINNRSISESQFKVPTRDLAAEIIEPAERICFGGEVPVKIRLTNVGTAPIRDSIVVQYTINGGGLVRERIRLSQPMDAGATQEYTFQKPASIAKSGSYALDVVALAFNDNKCANHYPSRRVLNYGGSDRKIFQTDKFTGCGFVLLNTGLVGSEHKWTLNGNPVGDNGPILNVTQSGTVRVEVTNAGCPGDPLTADLTVTVNPIPEITAKAVEEVCGKEVPNGLTLKINEAGSTQFDYVWKRRRIPPLAPEIIGNANELTVRQNENLIAEMTDKATGCTNTKDISVRIWNVKADLVAPTACGRQVIEANNPTTGEGCLYRWWIDSLCTGKWTLAQDWSRSSGLRSISHYELKRACYKVDIKDPLGCGESTDTIGFVTAEEQPAEGKTKRLEAHPACSHNIGTPEDPIRSTIPIVRVADADIYEDTTIFKSRMLHFVADYDEGATKYTGHRWMFPANKRANLRVFAKNGNGTRRILDLTDVSTELANQECISLFVVNNAAVQDVRCTLRVYSAIQDPVVVDPARGKFGCFNDYVYVFNAVLSNPNWVEDSPEIKCGNVKRENRVTDAYEVMVYPNPSTGVYSINADLKAVENLNAQVFDINGRLIFQQTWTGAESYTKEIDLSHVPAGVYILKLMGEKGFVSQRLVKE
jgi:hypothetical protein